MLANIKKLNSKGFSLVELNIAMAVSAVLSISFFVIFTSYLVTTTRTNASIQMTAESQTLLRSLVEEIRYGSGVRQINSIPDPNSPVAGWNTSNGNFVIITAVPAEKANHEYTQDPLTGSPYYNEYVYYKLNNILYKRTLANPSAIDNASQTSCSQTVSATACPAGAPKDRKLIETLEDMNFVLYNQDNGTTSDPLLARSIEINLTLGKKVFGNPLVYENSIRSTMRNTF